MNKQDSTQTNPFPPQSGFIIETQPIRRFRFNSDSVVYILKSPKGEIRCTSLSLSTIYDYCSKHNIPASCLTQV